TMPEKIAQVCLWISRGVFSLQERIDMSEKTCDQCARSYEEFEFCESRCMLQSCPKCTFLLQLYGTGCGSVQVYYLCRTCYDDRMKRGFVEP
ncbi:MAG: hypothetical protein AAGU11_20215, partial [Syntrophobacteraceae bacterium]